MSENLQKLKVKSKELGSEVKEKTLGYILAGLGVVAGLAWNDAIKSVIDYFIKVQESSVIAKLLYAVIITAIVVLVSIYLVRLLKKKD